MRRVRVSSGSGGKGESTVRFTAPRRVASTASDKDLTVENHQESGGLGKENRIEKDSAAAVFEKPATITPSTESFPSTLVRHPSSSTRNENPDDQGDEKNTHKMASRHSHSSTVPPHFASRSSTTVKTRTVFYPPPHANPSSPSMSLLHSVQNNNVVMAPEPSSSPASVGALTTTRSNSVPATVQNLAETPVDVPHTTSGRTDMPASSTIVLSNTVSPLQKDLPSSVLAERGLKQPVSSVYTTPTASGSASAAGQHVFTPSSPPSLPIGMTSPPLMVNLLRSRQQGRTIMTTPTATTTTMNAVSPGFISRNPSIVASSGVAVAPVSSAPTPAALPEGTHFFLKALEQIVQSESMDVRSGGSGGDGLAVHHQSRRANSTSRRRSHDPFHDDADIEDGRSRSGRATSTKSPVPTSEPSPPLWNSHDHGVNFTRDTSPSHLVPGVPPALVPSPLQEPPQLLPSITGTVSNSTDLQHVQANSRYPAPYITDTVMRNEEGVATSSTLTQPSAAVINQSNPSLAAVAENEPSEGEEEDILEGMRKRNESLTPERKRRRIHDVTHGASGAMSDSGNGNGSGSTFVTHHEKQPTTFPSPPSAVEVHFRADGDDGGAMEDGFENDIMEMEKEKEEEDVAYCPPADGPQLYTMRNTSQDHNRIWLSPEGANIAGDEMGPSDPISSISHASQQVLEHIHHHHHYQQQQIEWEESTSNSSTPLGSQFLSRVDSSTGSGILPLFPSQQLQLQQLQQWDYMNRNSQNGNEEENDVHVGLPRKERPSIEFIGLQTDNGAPLPPLCASQEDLNKNPYYQRLVADLQQTPHYSHTPLSPQQERVAKGRRPSSSLVTEPTSSATLSSQHAQHSMTSYVPPSYTSTMPSSSPSASTAHLTPGRRVTVSLSHGTDRVELPVHDASLDKTRASRTETSPMHPATTISEENEVEEEEQSRKENIHKNNSNDRNNEDDNDNKRITSYGLPADVATFYFAARGIRSLYPWQHEVLSTPAVRDEHRNFVYSLPTSGGKTLVAEVCLLRCMVQQRRSGMLVVPFVSIAEEKTAALAPLGTAFDFIVDGQYGTSGRLPPPPPKNGPITPYLFVCTIEKANSLLNFLLEEGRASAELGVVVVDELHMLGEGGRGATLELFLSKLLVLSSRASGKRDNDIPPALDFMLGGSQQGDSCPLSNAVPNSAGAQQGCQIIGMSATIPNLPDVARWLGAECYQSDFRPVQLVQYCVIHGERWRDGHPPPPAPAPVSLPSSHFTSALNVVDQVVSPTSLQGAESHVALGGGGAGFSSGTNTNILKGSEIDQLYALATELPEDASVLIFCASRQQTVSTAKGLAQLVRAEEGKNSSSAHTTLPEEFLSDVESHFSKNVVGQLRDVVPYRVAFHHAGLLQEEREWIERAYVQRHIRWLCCTSTLAAGVNLPARRVLFRSPYVARDFLTASRYRQMSGRAGRAGLDAYGDSFLLLSQKRDHERGRQLLQAPPEVCYSQLLEETGTLQRALMESIETGIVKNRREVVEWGKQLLCLYACRIQNSGSSSSDLTASESANDKLQDGLPEAVVHTERHAPTQEDAERVKSVTPPREKGSYSFHVTNSPSSRAASEKPSSSGIPLSTLTQHLFHSLQCLITAGLVHACKGVKNVTRNEKSSGDTNEALQEEEEEQLTVTPFGQSAVRSCFSVEEAMLVREEFDNLRRCGLILADDLHLCYFLTPLREIPNECDWGLYRVLLSRLSDDRQRIASLIGVDERFIDQRAMGIRQPARLVPPSPAAATTTLLPSTCGLKGIQFCSDERRQHFIACRFFVALLLADVLAEVPMETLEAKYNVTRGQVQSLMRSASMFSSSMTNFCRVMEWYALEAVLASFVKRLGFGAKPDIVPLMEIRTLTAGRARALWNAGFKSIQNIAETNSPEELVTRVKRASPPDSMVTKFFSVKIAKRIIQEAVCIQQKIGRQDTS